MIFATPSASHGSAIAVAKVGACGCPSDIAYERVAHFSIEKSLGLSPNETQSSAVNPSHAAIIAKVAPFETLCAEISISESREVECVTVTRSCNSR